jgi:hypothetical protein
MVVRAVILWVHVICGVGWVAACTTFVLAASALSGEPDESYAFAVKVAPQINRLCLPMAVAIPITGIGNLLFAARARSSGLPTEFVGILVAKVALLAIMVLGLSGAWRVAAILQGQSSPAGAAESPCGVSVRRIVAIYGLIVAAGVVALGLGLWLSGT